jgi:hypothetical protein
MLALKDQWIWDFWLHRDGPTWHIWFPKADRSLRDEGLRHWNVSYGHATSTNGHDWERVGNGLILDLQADDAVSALYEEYTLPDLGPWAVALNTTTGRLRLAS